MSRLYYDNAIDALYMAEKFGVMLFEEYRDGTAQLLDSEDIIEGIGGGVKYLIAPKSLDIFEPKEGDLIQGFKFNNFFTTESDKWTSAEAKIIQRNGMPFIMPKREVSDDR